MNTPELGQLLLFTYVEPANLYISHEQRGWYFQFLDAAIGEYKIIAVADPFQLTGLVLGLDVGNDFGEHKDVRVLVVYCTEHVLTEKIIEFSWFDHNRRIFNTEMYNA